METRARCSARRHASPDRYRCQEPCMRRCVRSARPSSNRTRRFLPRAPTDSIRAPASAFSSTPRRTSASAVSNRRTRAPCSALRSAVAARKTLSPSGIGLDIAAVVVLERIVRLPSRVGRTASREACRRKTGGFVVRIGEVWIIERRSELLPLAVAHRHA